MGDDYTKSQAAATSYMKQAPAAAILWEEFHLHGLASYPLLPLPPPLGPRPPRWRLIARRRWERARETRAAAKAWNFGALYGCNVSQIDEAIVIENRFPFTWDAWEQMFPPGIILRDERHTQTQDSVVE